MRALALLIVALLLAGCGAALIPPGGEPPVEADTTIEPAPSEVALASEPPAPEPAPAETGGQELVTPIPTPTVGATPDGPPPSASLGPASAPVGCETARWAVATLSDPFAEGVAIDEPFRVTPAELVALARPENLPDERRSPPAELRVYSLLADLVSASLSADGAVRLVIAQPGGDERLVAIIPREPCLGETRLDAREPIAETRYVWEQGCQAALTGGPVGFERTTVDLKGVAFFAPAGDPAALAPNGIALAPLLDLRFPEGCAIKD